MYKNINVINFLSIPLMPPLFCSLSFQSRNFDAGSQISSFSSSPRRFLPSLHLYHGLCLSFVS